MNNKIPLYGHNHAGSVITEAIIEVAETYCWVFRNLQLIYCGSICIVVFNSLANTKSIKIHFAALLYFQCFADSCSQL